MRPHPPRPHSSPKMAAMVMEHEEQSVESAGGLKLYYQAWHPPGEPRTAVAIIHGVGEHSGRF